MDDNMNYNQVNDNSSSGESQPIYQEQVYQTEPSAERYFGSVPADPIPQGMGSVPVADAQPKSNGLAIAGMVCGIVAAVFVCCFFPVSILCAIAGIVLSIIALIKKQSKGMAITGIITSVVSLLLSIVIIVMTVVFSLSVVEEIENGTYDEYYYNELYEEIYDDMYDQYF